jgi:protoporphyrinogen oxidase
MAKIVIIGAGITGCVAACELAKKGLEVVVIERNACVGGLARTFRYGEFIFDIGPHLFFTREKFSRDIIVNALGDNNQIPAARHSDVYLFGRYYSWPLRPSLLFTLPLKEMLAFARDLFSMMGRHKETDVKTFKDYIVANYGSSLYTIFFKDYTCKFLGLPPEDVHADWAREGMRRAIIDEAIASRDLFDIMKLLFFFNPATAGAFVYPPGGTGMFCKRLAEEAERRGVEMRMNARITGISHSAGSVEGLTVDSQSMSVEEIVWTGSLPDVCGLLRLPCEGLHYLSLLLFNIEVNKPIRNYQWCYYGGKDIVFSRVSIPASFYEKAVPDGKGSLCVEVTCRTSDPEWGNPRLLLEKVEQGLIRTGILKHKGEIENVHIEKIPDAYPLYTKNYAYDLRKVKDALRAFNNLILAGRTGLFWYNTMNDCIENGLLVAKTIGERRPAQSSAR